MSPQELGPGRAVAVTAPAPQTPSPSGAGTMRDFTAFPVYEGAHKKGLWAIVPRGSIQEEIKLLKNKRALHSSELGRGGCEVGAGT